MNGELARVIANGFPALRADADGPSHACGPWTLAPGAGAHEVVIETRAHAPRPKDVSARERTLALRAWRARVRVHSADARWAYVALFRNQGPLAGASLAHPHAQILATPHLPRGPAIIAAQHSAWFSQQGQSLMRSILDDVETSRPELLLAETPHAVAFCPFASDVPWEVWIVPRIHAPSIADWSDEVLEDCASLLRDAEEAIAAAADHPDVHLTLPQAPLRPPDLRASTHAFLRVQPALQPLAGYEIHTLQRVNPLPPEVAAKRLREVWPPTRSAPPPLGRPPHLVR